MSRRAAAALATIEADGEIEAAGGLPLPGDLTMEEFDNGVGLRQYLLDGYRKGRLTAKDVCTLSWHAQRAGAHGVEDISLSPLQTGGNFQSHLEQAVGLRSADSFYLASIPMWNHQDQQRSLEPFPFVLPHIIFRNCYIREPLLFDQLNLDHCDVPPSWWDHPVFKSHGGDAFPVALYSDGVPHSKSDGFVCWYFSLVNSKQRHLVCTLRKSDVCRCGCKGNCSFGSIQRVIAWSMNQLASGQMPSRDHLGNLIPNATLGEIADGKVGGLVEYRGDLLEMTSAFGFTNWSNVLNPCFLCGANRGNMFDYPSDVASCIWPERDAAAYDIMIERSLKKVRVISGAQWKKLIRVMEFDEKMAGYGLFDDFADLGLEKGWRLIEDGPVSDIHDLCGLRFPCWLTFFNSRNTMGLNFVCHLFQIVGFTSKCLALDLMHVFDLGVSQRLIGTILRILIKRNFAKSALKTAKGKQVANLVALRRQVRCKKH